MLNDYVNGQTSVVLRFKLRDSSVTTGAGLTGLTSASTGLIISTIADNEAAATVYTVAASHIETITTLGTYATPTALKCRFKEVDATNHPGLYEFQFADARFAVASSKSLLISVSGATNLAQADVLIPLKSVNSYDAQRAGLSVLPSTGTLAVKPAVTLANTDVTGNLAADLQTIKTQAVTCAAGVTVLASVGTATTSTAQTGDAFALIGAAGVNLTSVKLASAGLDSVVVESGINARQALSPILAACGGVLAGALTTSVTIAAGGNPGTNRISATVDTSGNRSAVTLNLPA